MKPLALAILALLVALIAIPWAIGINVAVHGQPTAWGSCK